MPVDDWVEAQQERAYRDAAEALGLGIDPVSAWERLTTIPGWSQVKGSEAVRGRPGWDQLTEAELAQFDDMLAADRARDADPLPTR